MIKIILIRLNAVSQTILNLGVILMFFIVIGTMFVSIWYSNAYNYVVPIVTAFGFTLMFLCLMFNELEKYVNENYKK